MTDLAFFEKVVEFAKENNIWVIHDLAYADLVFDGYKAPSFLQAKGAKDVGVEFYTMSKSYSMPGWRVGFCLGNPKLIHALSRIKSYLDYGIFQPIQIAATVGMRSGDEEVTKICDIYRQRRDWLIDGLNRIPGVYSPIPMGAFYTVAKLPVDDSEKFCRWCLEEFSYEGETVMMAPAQGFYTTPGAGRNQVRIAYVLKKDDLERALVVLRKALELYPGRDDSDE